METYKVTAAIASEASARKRKRSAETPEDTADPQTEQHLRTEQQLQEQAITSTGGGRNMLPAGFQERAEPPAAHQERTEPWQMRNL